MKIFSSFDLHGAQRLVEEAWQHYGEKNVLFVRRHFIYIVIRVILPITVWLVFVGFLIWLIYGAMHGTGGIYTFIRWLVWGMVIVTGVYLFWKAAKLVIDYYMDFVIITPREISAYNQRGILTTTTRTLDITKVKSVRVQKSGLLKSIFNYGSIVFFSEGDQSGDLGDITLHYITEPNELRQRIDDILLDAQHTVNNQQ